MYFRLRNHASAVAFKLDMHARHEDYSRTGRPHIACSPTQCSLTATRAAGCNTGCNTSCGLRQVRRLRRGAPEQPALRARTGCEAGRGRWRVSRATLRCRLGGVR